MMRHVCIVLYCRRPSRHVRPWTLLQGVDLMIALCPDPGHILALSTALQSVAT